MTSVRETVLLPLILLVLGVVVALAATHVSGLLVVAGVLGIVFLPLAVVSSKARLIAMLGGALLVFQSQGNTGKIAYLGIVIVCLLVAVNNLLRHESVISRAFRPMLGMGIVVMFVLVMSYFVATGNGIPTVMWVRDALTYFLLVALPIIGLEASQSLSRRFLHIALAIAAPLTAIGFAADWLSRRGATDTVGRFILSTATLTVLGFAYVVIRCCSGRQPTRWFLVAAVMSSALLITGTRTNIVLIVAALVGMIGSRRRKAHIPLLRAIGFAAALALSVAAVIPFISTYLALEKGFLGQRVQALVAAIQGGLATDQSYQIRQIAYAVARARWEQSPFFGGGPGYVYPSVGDITLDTPWIVPAKFGIIGTAVLVLYLLTIARCVIRVRRRPDIEFTMARSWAVAVVAITPFGPWLEDKGTGVALMMIVAMTAVASRDAQAESESGPETASLGAVDVHHRAGTRH